MTTPEITRIRAALQAFDETPLTIGQEWALEDALQRVCNPAAMTAVLAYIDAQAAEIKRQRAALRTIAELHPDKYSDEGYNEWGETDCFGKAQAIAIEAIKGATP